MEMASAVWKLDWSVRRHLLIRKAILWGLIIILFRVPEVFENSQDFKAKKTTPRQMSAMCGKVCLVLVMKFEEAVGSDHRLFFFFWVHFAERL